MSGLVKKFFDGATIFGKPILSKKQKLDLVLNDPAFQNLLMSAYEEGRNDVLYIKTHKTKETLLIALKELL